MLNAENAYLILPREDVLTFIISAHKGEPKGCRLTYDGGEHAVFYRTDDDTVILDYINESVRERLSTSKTVAIIEVDYEKGTVVQSYRVKVAKVKKVVIDPKTLADLKKKREEADAEAKAMQGAVDLNELPLIG